MEQVQSPIGTGRQPGPFRRSPLELRLCLQRPGPVDRRLVHRDPGADGLQPAFDVRAHGAGGIRAHTQQVVAATGDDREDRKSTRLNSSHVAISYAVFCLKKKNRNEYEETTKDVDT